MSLLRSRSLMLVAIAGLASTAACAAPEAQKASTKTVAQKDIVFSAPASPTSKKELGITRWHTIVEPSTNAYVVDGVDAKGNVKFITSYRLDKKTGTYTIENHLQKGKLSFTKDGTVKSDTLSMSESWKKQTTLMATDWYRHSQTKAYGFLGQYSDYVKGAGIAIGAGFAIAGAVVSCPVTCTVGAVAGAAIGAAALLDDRQTKQEEQGKAAQDERNQEVKDAVNDNRLAGLENPELKQALENKANEIKNEEQQNQNQNQNDGTNASSSSSSSGGDGTSSSGGDGTSSSSSGGDGTSSSSGGDGTSSSGGDGDGTSSSSSSSGGGGEGESSSSSSGGGGEGGGGEPAPTELPAGNDGNLDTAGNSGGGSGGGEGGGGAETTGGGEGGGGAETTGGGEGGGGEGAGGGEGGGDATGGEFARANVCRKVLVSKTTKVRACAKY